MKMYGIREQTPTQSESLRHAEELRILGQTLVTDLLSEEQLVDLRRRLDAVYEKQAAEVGGAHRLAKINDADVARSLLAYDATFQQVAMLPRLLAVMTELLGEYFLLQQQNGIINRPGNGNYQSAWHRDLPYQHFTTSRPIAVSALICLDDFNDETGGTLVLTGTHKVEVFPSEAFVTAHERTVTAKAGSAIVFDSLLYHRAGTNRSQSPRRGLNHVYCIPMLKQQISLPRALSREIRDPWERKFLGFDSEPGESALDWRKRRLPPE